MSHNMFHTTQKVFSYNTTLQVSYYTQGIIKEFHITGFIPHTRYIHIIPHYMFHTAQKVYSYNTTLQVSYHTQSIIIEFPITSVYTTHST